MEPFRDDLLTVSFCRWKGVLDYNSLTVINRVVLLDFINLIACPFHLGVLPTQISVQGGAIYNIAKYDLKFYFSNWQYFG